MQLHPASLLVGAALAICVGLLSAQQIVGSPAVEVRVIETPTLRISGPMPRAFPGPPQNGSSTLILGPGETATLSSLRLQWYGDTNTAADAQARFELWVNGTAFENSGRTIDRNFQVAGSYDDYAHAGYTSFRLRAGDVLTVKRVPHSGNPPEADAAMPTTWLLDIEQD